MGGYKKDFSSESLYDTIMMDTSHYIYVSKPIEYAMARVSVI